MRSRFDDDMARLKEMLIGMGAMCESAIASAMKALLENNKDNLASVHELEEQINKREREIEALCLQLILRQQPVARDLRQISSALKMITDMERIGDHASDIAEIVEMWHCNDGEQMATIKEMALAAIGMVTDSVESYVNQDVDLARKVIESDDIVDDLFNKCKKGFAKTLVHETEDAEGVIDLLMVSKYLERIGDHAVNIAEWVIFAATGSHPPKNPSEFKGNQA